jgi:hypothetical protein
MEELSQLPKGMQASFDVATVVLNADAAKVYATTIGTLRKNQPVHATTEDAGHRTVNFTNVGAPPGSRLPTLVPGCRKWRSHPL